MEGKNNKKILWLLIELWLYDEWFSLQSGHLVFSFCQGEISLSTELILKKTWVIKINFSCYLLKWLLPSNIKYVMKSHIHEDWMRFHRPTPLSRFLVHYWPFNGLCMQVSSSTSRKVKILTKCDLAEKGQLSSVWYGWF